MFCVMTVQNRHNDTVLLNNPMMVEESHYFWWKASIIFLDIFGLTFNGLGIDMIWHGVEVNHAVYFVILQDLCLAFVTTLASQIFNWFFWYDDLLWFRFYGLLAMLPFIFHNWAWASIAQLRYFFEFLSLIIYNMVPTAKMINDKNGFIFKKIMKIELLDKRKNPLIF